MTRFWLALLTAFFLLAPTGAEARKVALVIGNSDYANTPGTFTRTLDGDASDYRVTYTLTVS